jgi:hypothetical protein
MIALYQALPHAGRVLVDLLSFLNPTNTLTTCLRRISISLVRRHAGRSELPLDNSDDWPTEDDVDHFMQHGYIVVRGAFTQEQADDWTKDAWVRLGMDPNDRSTWNQEKVHMPVQRSVPFKDFAPKVRHHSVTPRGHTEFINTTL